SKRPEEWQEAELAMSRPLAWALAVAGIAVAALVTARAVGAQGLGVIAGANGPGVLIAAYEILRVLDKPVDEAARKSACLAAPLLAVPILVLISFARTLGVEVPWPASR